MNAQIKSDGDGQAEWQDWLEDESADQAADLAERDELEGRRELLMKSMRELNERERHILTERKLESPVTLEELSEVLQRSVRERIRQIQVRAVREATKRCANSPSSAGRLRGSRTMRARIRRSVPKMAFRSRRARC